LFWNVLVEERMHCGVRPVPRFNYSTVVLWPDGDAEPCGERPLFASSLDRFGTSSLMPRMRFKRLR
jgi:hypothetical protein